MVDMGQTGLRVHRALKRTRGRDNAGLVYDGYSILLLIGGLLSLPALMLEARLSGSMTWSLVVSILLWCALAARTAVLTRRSPWGGRPPTGRPPEPPSGNHEEGEGDVRRSD